LLSYATRATFVSPGFRAHIGERDAVSATAAPTAAAGTRTATAAAQVGVRRCFHGSAAFRFALACLGFALRPIELMSCAENHAASPVPSPNEVLAEMSRRSAVPEAELKQRLTSCEAEQQNMYFCAFRDFIAVDIQLDRIAAEQTRRHPECKEPIEHQLRDLREQRDRACAKSAAEEYGAGSMARTAIAVCASSSTKPLIDQVTAMGDCPPAQSRPD